MVATASWPVRPVSGYGRGQVVEEIASKLGRCLRVSDPWIIVICLCAHGLDVGAIDTPGVGSRQPCPGFSVESAPVAVKVLSAWWVGLVRHDRVRALTNRGAARRWRY